MIKETYRRDDDYVSFQCSCGYVICNDPRPLTWGFCPSCGQPWKRPESADNDEQPKFVHSKDIEAALIAAMEPVIKRRDLPVSEVAYLIYKELNKVSEFYVDQLVPVKANENAATVTAPSQPKGKNQQQAEDSTE